MPSHATIRVEVEVSSNVTENVTSKSLYFANGNLKQLGSQAHTCPTRETVDVVQSAHLFRSKDPLTPRLR